MINPKYKKDGPQQRVFRAFRRSGEMVKSLGLTREQILENVKNLKRETVK